MNKDYPVSSTTPQEYFDFWSQVLQAFGESKYNPQAVYPLLQANLDKLDDSFAKYLTDWVNAVLSQAVPEEAEDIAYLVFIFSDLLGNFPLGNRGNNLEIAIAGYGAIFTALDRDRFPEMWGAAGRNLGVSYRHRIRGDREENLELAIAIYLEVLEVCTRDNFPKLWGTVQTNLANAYCERIRGNRGENLELAIAAFEATLQVHTPKENREGWALIQANLGITYYERIGGDRVENLKLAIAAFEAALQVYTPEAFPEKWQWVRQNLGIAYHDAIQAGVQVDMNHVAQLTGFNENYQFLMHVLQVTSQSQGNPQVVYPILAANLDKLNERMAELLDVVIRDKLAEVPPQEAPMLAVDIGWFSDLMLEFPLGSRASSLEIAIAGYKIVGDIFNFQEFPEQWAMTQKRLGRSYMDRIRGDRGQNLEDSIQFYQRALQVYTQEAFTQQWAETISRLGIAYKDRIVGDREANLEQAIAYYNQALEVLTAEKFPRQCGETQDNLGTAYQLRIAGDRADNLEKAIATRKAALEVYTREEYPFDWALVQNNLGTAYRIRILGDRAENIESAIAAYQGAASVWTRERYPERWASLQINLSNAYDERLIGDHVDNLKQAIVLQENVLEIFTPAEFPEQWTLVQRNLFSKFMSLVSEVGSTTTKGGLQAIYSQLQPHLEKLDEKYFGEQWRLWTTHLLEKVEPDKLVDMAGGIASFSGLLVNIPSSRQVTNLEMAILGYQAVDRVFARAKYPENWADNQINLGSAYYYRIRGDRAENLAVAINYFHSALSHFTRETNLRKWAQIQVKLGLAYSEQIQGNRAENLEKALNCFLAVADIFRETDLAEWVNIQTNLGMIYCRRMVGDRSENIEKGISTFKTVLAKEIREDFPDTWAIVQNNLGRSYFDRIAGDRAENLADAIPAFRASLEVRTRTDFPAEWAKTQTNLGLVYGEQGQIEEAIKCFHAAMTVFTPTTFPESCFNTGRFLGDMSFTAGRWQEAITGYQVAIDAVEQSRAWAVSDRRRQEILENAIALYARIIQTYINTGKANDAIQYVERSKARNLVDLLATRNLYPKGNISVTIIQELDRLRREIAAQQRQSHGIPVDSNKNLLPDASTNNSTSLRELQQQLDRLITEKIQPLDPTFSLTQRIESIRYPEIRELLPDNRTILMEWYLTEDRVYTFIVTPERATPTIIPSPTENYQALIAWIVDYLETYLQNKQLWKTSLPDRLVQLGEILQIDHLISLVQDECDHIILVPHRFLHLMPLHAIALSDGRCLLDRFSRGVRYTPSCQLLQLTQNQQRPEFQRFFAMQNPTKDLQYADMEVKAIRPAFSPHDDVIVQDAANKASINNQRLQNSNCVHFACHGDFDFRDPLASILVLAGAKNSSNLDREKCLSLGEIFSLNLNQCRLVTLSACETGLTDPSSLSDEYIGLPSGFLFAGSPSVVSSLWTVNDLSCALLMIRFYQHLHTGVSVAFALNQAQIWLRDSTVQDLRDWAETSNLPTEITQEIVEELDIYNSDERIYSLPEHWAAFCAIGQ
ncbi:hypothetical protein NIES4101_43740 [Calothrix sp. NIES-4101]|nr:hypothetical protein NIES4101_43740 [Calothrix sp. NIES-4101]